MEMTFQQYIDNPLGKRNAVFSQRDMYRNLYTDKYNKLVLREAGKIVSSLYIDKKTNRYIIHVKVPSESVKNYYYDAVVCFYTNDPAIAASGSLDGYSVKFFSNDPAFVFTYLRAFLKHDLFFEDCKPKASKQALENDPTTTNPYELPGYSKILYFTYLYMKSKNLFQKHMFVNFGESYTKTKLLNNIEHTDVKLSKGKELRSMQAKEAAKVRKMERANKLNTMNSLPTDTSSAPKGNVKLTKAAKTVGAVRRSPTVKATKSANTVKTTSKKSK